MNVKAFTELEWCRIVSFYEKELENGGKCIKLGETWMTLNEFQVRAGSNCKNLLASIKYVDGYLNQPLGYLIKNGEFKLINNKTATKQIVIVEPALQELAQPKNSEIKDSDVPQEIQNKLKPNTSPIKIRKNFESPMVTKSSNIQPSMPRKVQNFSQDCGCKICGQKFSGKNRWMLWNQHMANQHFKTQLWADLVEKTSPFR